MEEQIPMSLSINKDNNQENLVVQPNPIIWSKREYIIFRFYILGFCIYGIKIIYYLFLWFLNLIGSSINYNYETHTNKIDEKYFTQFNIILFPNLLLSGIIIYVGVNYLSSRLKITVLINSILIAGKILLFIFYYKTLKKIYYGGSIVPKISIGIEAIYIFIIIILEIIKLIIIR